MSLYRYFKIAFFTFVLLAISLLQPKSDVKAQLAACACDKWTMISSYEPNNSPPGYYTVGVCNEPGYDCSSPTCGPGTYPCNRASDGGCCPQDVPTPDTGGGSGNPPTTGCTGSCPCTGCVTNTTCSQTPPTNLASVSVSATSANLSWTPGAAAGSAPYQALYVSTNSDPQVGCAGSGGGTAVCPVRHDSSTTALPSTQNGYSIVNLLAPNTLYYWTVMNIQNADCWSAVNSNTTGDNIVSSCTVSPSSMTLVVGTSQILTSSLTSGNGISQVTFTSNGPAFASVSPASDSSYSFQTTVTGVSATSPSTTITENVYTAGVLACTQNSTVVVTNPDPWWQVKDSDVTSNSSIDSDVPTGQYFSTAGSGGYPGIPSYFSSTNLTTSNASSVGWLAQSGVASPKVYDYQYFNNQIPDDTLISNLGSGTLDQAAIDANTSPSHGFYWYKYTGAISGLDLNVNTAINIGAKKVIILVDSANFNVAAPITLTDGQGMFMVVVGKDSSDAKGNITVNPALGGNPYDLEGIYIADGTFNTGVAATQLKVRGTVVGYEGINLQRDLGSDNTTTPAEIFEYAPDQILLFSSNLGIRRINWKEVAP